MRTKNKTAITVSCFLLAAFSVSDAKESADPTISAALSPYPVIDSGVWADWDNAPKMYWLDNQRVIFLGTETRDKPKNRQGLQIQIWDISNNKVIPYANTKSGILYYNDGVIAYRIDKDSDGNQSFRCGKLNQEKTIVLPKNKKMYFDFINCQIQSREENVASRKERRSIRPLLKQHGYLDYGPDSVRPVPLGKKAGPILFYQTGKKEPVPLPITNETIRNIEYYQFKQAYFVHYFNGYQGSWWLYPNGRAEEIKFPTVPKLLIGGHFFPLREDFFVSRGSSKIDSGKDPGDAGGYLLRNTGIFKLVSGYTVAEVISPDGCKVAFVNYPYIDATRLDDPARVTLKAINFCTEEK